LFVQQRVPALAGITGPAMLWAIFTFLGTIHPGYSPIRYDISLLAIMPYGWLQNAAFVAFGLSIIIFEQGLERTLAPDRSWDAFRVFAVVFGLGFVALSIFRTDPPGIRTIHGTVHLVVVGVLALLFPAACFVIAPTLRRHAFWHGYAWFTVLAGILTLALLTVWLFVRVDLSPWDGLWERVFLAVPCIWMEVTAIHLLEASVLPRRNCRNLDP
jgi:hypothetical protein